MIKESLAALQYVDDPQCALILLRGVSDIHGQHLLQCERAKNKGHIYRHNRFRDAVANLCRDIGCQVEVEANNLFDSTSERPADIYVDNDDTKLRLAIDVSLTSPHIVDNKSVNSVEGYAANKRQLAKAQTYGDRLNKIGITCAPSSWNIMEDTRRKRKLPLSIN